MVPGGNHFVAQLYENYRHLRGNVEKVVSEQNTTLLKFVEEKKVLRKELEQSEARKKELEKELEQYGIRMELVVKELEQSGVQKQELKKELEKSEAERAELSKQFEQKEAYNNELLLKQKLKGELGKSEVKKEELSKKLEQIEAQNKELQKLVSEQETVLFNNEQQLKDHKNLLEQSEARKKELEKELDKLHDLQKKVLQQQTGLLESEAKVKDFKSKLENSESDNKELRQKLEKNKRKRELEQQEMQLQKMPERAIWDENEGEIQQRFLGNEEVANMEALNAEAFVKDNSYAELLDSRLQLINPLVSGKKAQEVKLLLLSTAEASGDKSTAASPITVGDTGASTSIIQLNRT